MGSLAVSTIVPGPEPLAVLEMEEFTNIELPVSRFTVAKPDVLMGPLIVTTPPAVNRILPIKEEFVPAVMVLPGVTVIEPLEILMILRRRMLPSL